MLKLSVAFSQWSAISSVPRGLLRVLGLSLYTAKLFL